jgi:hypothetical protein
MFWDKGPSALKVFIQTHVCNSLCEYLELDDLVNFDVDKIVMKLEQARKAEDEQARMKAAERTQLSDENSSSGCVSQATSVEHH